jgi:hypothetical protein
MRLAVCHSAADPFQRYGVWAAGGVALVFAARLAFGHLVGSSRLGIGPQLALVGATLTAAAAWLPVPVRSLANRVLSRS